MEPNNIKQEKTITINNLYLKKITNIKEIHPEEEYITSYFDAKENYHPYAIIRENYEQVIGYIYLDRMNDTTMYLQFIEILDSYKENHYGSNVVKALFGWFPHVESLEGTILEDSSLRAYYFWLSTGAEIDALLDDNDEPNFDLEVIFYLKKEVAYNQISYS